ncbi:O52B4 protein, partial [Pelecanoides urinatrix]|nr:O52B4 protein [Pelecanoides urinatrix]
AVMLAGNCTALAPITCLLMGISGTGESHLWISTPFTLMYMVAVLGNFILSFVNHTEKSLHEPSYLFLPMLAAADLLLSTSTMPKTLAIFWFRAGEVSLEACFTPVFLILVVSCAESAILLAMAFDGYIAICKPSKYVSLLIQRMTGTIARSLSTVFPVVVLVKHLVFCRNKPLPHTYCKRMGIAKLACADITMNVWRGVTIAVFVLGTDATLTAVSYALILQTVFQLPSKNAWLKALSTRDSHLLVILLYFTLGFSSFLHTVLGAVFPVYPALIIVANLCVLFSSMLNPIIYGVTNKEFQ